MIKHLATYWMLALLLWPMLMHAGSVLELTVDGGYSTTLYSVASDGKRLAGIGYGADVEYAYFFHKNVGLSLGFGVRHYAGGARIDGTIHYKEVADIDHEPYEHITTYSNWREKQDMYYMEFPVSLQFFVPMKGVNLWMSVGANYSLALAGRTAAQGDINHIGYYQKWDLTLDVPAYGFYSTSDFKPTTRLKPQSLVAMFARLDIGIPLNKRLDLTIGASAYYAVMAAYPLAGTTPLGFRNDQPGWEEAHAFMSDYSSMLVTPVVSGKACPLSANLEIGLRYRLPHHHKTYPCRCAEH